jgi:hypothetical protein
MDPVAIILTALTTGAAAAGQAVASDAIKDSYTGLKALIQRKFADKPKAELVLTEYESEPETWETPLKKALVEAHVEQEQEILEAAHRVLNLVQSQQTALSKISLQITGNVQGIAQGDHQQVTMNFDHKPKKKE